ncbi:MAG: hypothetical protein KJ926_04020 [Candidatus Omnitrophica bacterium]|nr:hypothetical protein [Candidatus Omnitrophota bacterium]MBU1929755.1 hypothetical protein [Candidatus Omnitrophota bacterium]MBU2034922.1 hypothetical protein [Candidatus Omnitrophota bacterium]MBU2258270.1 hypothetical protein [Candidatus Omnitrophota bacterium]
MIHFESQYFQKLTFQAEQVEQFLRSATRDLKIARESDIPDVIFKFCYDALIKLSIMLIAKKGYKVRSAAGHHVKILEKLSQLLKDKDILVLGNKMRQERNLNLYDGGCFVGEKDSLGYLEFVKSAFKKAGV